MRTITLAMWDSQLAIRDNLYVAQTLLVALAYFLYVDHVEAAKWRAGVHYAAGVGFVVALGVVWSLTNG